MSDIRSTIELQDNFTGILNNIINVVNMSVSTIEQMQSTMASPIDTASIEGMRNQLGQATTAVRELNDAVQNIEVPSVDMSLTPVSVPVDLVLDDASIAQPEPVVVPVQWQSDQMPVFTTTGTERFAQEVQSANTMMNTLYHMQAQIASRAAQINVFPPNMIADMTTMQTRLQAIRERISLIEHNPINLGTNTANAQLEHLRSQLAQAIQAQDTMNQAINHMDIDAANNAYLRLSQIISGTEQHIRDNVDEQGRFNQLIRDGTSATGRLKSMLAGTIGAYLGLSGFRKALNYIQKCTDAYNVQLNAETQLASTLANTLDQDYISNFKVVSNADISGAVNDINDISNNIAQVTIPVTVETTAEMIINDETFDRVISTETRALEAAYNQLTAKASEIQTKGVYGDEIMIAAAAEFSTYFSDTNAIELMMDTLSNYAAGMSGGGEIDTNSMVNYATNLGKIMNGTYTAMAQKGFTFTDTQKAIIEGTATEAQIVAALGKEYLNMSADMQAAAAISSVIGESWGGLYEHMSNTPQGKIIQLKNSMGDLREVIGGQLYPAALNFVDVLNTRLPQTKQIMSGIASACSVLLSGLTLIAGAAIDVGSAIVDNWRWIEPLVLGIVAAMVVYNATFGIAWATTMKNVAASVAHGVASAAQSVAIWGLVLAQEGLNAAMRACPVTFILMGIIAIATAVVALVRHFDLLGAQSTTVLGTMCGLINVVIQWFWNLALMAANVGLGIKAAMGATADNIVIAFENALLSVQGFFYDLSSTALMTISEISQALNKLPFIEFDYSGIVAKADEYAAKSAQAYNSRSEYVNISEAFDVGLHTFDVFSDHWNKSAFDVGAAFGDSLMHKLGNFSPLEKMDFSAYGIGNNDVYGDIADTATNTGAMADTMDITAEELKYLRDIAEQEVVNRFTTAEITIEQTNHNNISKDVDLDGFVSSFTDIFSEAVTIATEGTNV